MQNTSIGRCEGWCGTVDHHLVDGLCEACRLRSLTTDSEPEPEMACNDIGPALVLDALHTPADVCWLPGYRRRERSLFMDTQAS